MIFGFKTALEKAQEKEIEFLRGEVKELTLQLVAMSGRSAEYWNVKLADKKTSTDTSKAVDSVIKKIEDRPALTEDQKKQKEQALRYAYKVYSGC